MIIHTKPSSETVPGFWDLEKFNISIPNPLGMFFNFKTTQEDIVLIDKVLDSMTCLKLKNMFLQNEFKEDVSVFGLKECKDNYGSKRSTAWFPKLAEQLSIRIIPKLNIMIADKFTATDWWQDDKYNVWKPVCVSPIMRFMLYNKGGEHYAHYDSAYFYPDNEHRTLKSVVLYLTTNKSGSTRFIKDEQESLPIWERNHNDWNRRTKANEIKLKFLPKCGSALIFDHRLCHDVESLKEDEDRIIIRTDIIYKKIKLRKD